AAEVGLANAVAEANAAAPPAMDIAPIAPVAPAAPAPAATPVPVVAQHVTPAASTAIPAPAPIAAPARGLQKEEPPMIQHMVPTAVASSGSLSATPSSLRSAAGVLVARSADPAAKTAIATFLRQLGLSLAIVDADRPSDGAGATIADEFSRLGQVDFA